MNNKIEILSGNILKLIACFSMAIDHIGCILYPNLLILRIIGRIAFPIFAFMIAEGCYYTKNRLKHFLIIFIMAVLMQVVFYFAMNSLSLSIFAIFSFSIILIYLFDSAKNNLQDGKNILGSLFILLFVGLTISLYFLNKKTNIMIDNYGFYGVIVPVVLYILRMYTKRNIWISIAAFALMLIAHVFIANELINLYELIGIGLLCLYNGKRGKYNMKYFFYVFYPVHIVVIYGIYLLMK